MTETKTAELLRTLKDLRAWLKYQREINTISRSNGDGGHNGNGNCWSAVAIPEWDVRQKLDAVEDAISEAERP